jgi:hypothetical protein
MFSTTDIFAFMMIGFAIVIYALIHIHNYIRKIYNQVHLSSRPLKAYINITIDKEGNIIKAEGIAK